MNNPDHPIIHIMNDAGVFSITVLLNNDNPYPIPRMIPVIKSDKEIINNMEMDRNDSILHNGEYKYYGYTFSIDGERFEFILSAKAGNDELNENYIKEILKSFKKI